MYTGGKKTSPHFIWMRKKNLHEIFNVTFLTLSLDKSLEAYNEGILIGVVNSVLLLYCMFRVKII